MINVLIIEDEAPARRKLQRFLADLDDPVTVAGECETITEAVQYLEEHPNVHIILSDISLRDGNAFSIYEQVAVLPPIIFITAYSDYLMDAFKTNGIAYLVKPYTFDQFKKAWKKFLNLRNAPIDYGTILTKLNILITADTKPAYKKRFAVHSGRGTQFLETNTIVYFVAEDSLVFAIDMHNQRHLLSHGTLKEVAEVLDPGLFFQINRSELVHISFIERTERYGKNSIAIILKGVAVCLITSQSKSAPFREWLNQ